MALAEGTPAPDFMLMDQRGGPVSLADLRGSKALVVFIPYPFTRVCEGEMCEIRDRLAGLGDLEAAVVAITCDTVPSNRRWAKDQGYEFPVLSDFWPHGRTSRAYDTFNEGLGVAEHTTYVLDEEGVVRSVVASPGFGIAREFEEYEEALSAI